MVFSLQNVPSWKTGLGCVPQAISAITGLDPSAVISTINTIVTNRGGVPQTQHGDSFCINDWLEAIKQLGGDHAPLDDYSSAIHSKRSGIVDYLNQMTPTNSLVFVLCENESGDSTHVFATDGIGFVDVYTFGQVESIKNAAPPPDFNAYRVKRTFLVWNP